MFHIELCPELLNQLADAGVATVAERSKRPIAGAKSFIGVPQGLIHAIDNEPNAAEMRALLGVIGAVFASTLGTAIRGSMLRTAWIITANHMISLDFNL